MTPPDPESPSRRLRIDVHVETAQFGAALANDVRWGFAATPKQIPPKYFYDDVGSELFERITQQPEYYPARAERRLLEMVAADLMARLRPIELVELGSGFSSKTRILLGAASAPDHLQLYVPFDVSEGIVRESAKKLVNEYPYLSVHGVIGDFESDLPKIPAPGRARLVLFLGSTIGNLHPPQRHVFLERIREVIGPHGHALVGMDLVKERSAVERAYDDAAGVTAAFNRNLLRVINRELDADFVPEAFDHVALFNAVESRIEMHLEAREAQCVKVGALGMDVHLRSGERIWTEASYKFSRAAAERSFADAGLALADWFTTSEPSELFGLALVTTA